MPDHDLHYLLLYDYVPDMVDRREPFRSAHLERIRIERDTGHIAHAGAFDPPTGAAIVFQGVEHDYIEHFVRNDPYHAAGLITDYRIEKWNVMRAR